MGRKKKTEKESPAPKEAKAPKASEEEKAPKTCDCHPHLEGEPPHIT